MFPGFEPIERRSEGCPNLARILIEEGWEGQPPRTGAPLGGGPARFPRMVE